MARGTQLNILITMLRAEVGQSISPAIGVDNLPALKQKLSRVQELLYDDYDWPFLRKTFYVPLAAGQRYYQLPTVTDEVFSNTLESQVFVNAGLNMERIEEVAINYSGKPLPVDRGISFEQYAQYNSDAATPDRASPVRRWDIKRVSSIDTDADMLEVWPIPADDTQIFCFKGIRQLRPLVAMEDITDLDDQLIVLHVAAEILARSGAKDAGAVAAAAVKRKNTLQGRTKGASRQMNMAGPRSGENNRGRTIIRIGSSTN